VVLRVAELIASQHVPVGTTVTLQIEPTIRETQYTWAKLQGVHDPRSAGTVLVATAREGAVALHQSAPVLTADELAQLRRIATQSPRITSRSGRSRARDHRAYHEGWMCPFAAVEWGGPTRAKCLDVPTLQPFWQEHYNTATDLCVPARPRF